MERSDPAYKGQAGYNPVMLAIYDPWVLGFMSRVVLHVPIPPFVENYRANLGHRHLDVGPGTGYFLAKAAPPEGTEITLLDPNPHVLRRAGRRLASLSPTAVEADVMKPLPVSDRFDSAALSFVLHCLRGPDANKAIAIRNIADVLTPDGVLFGGTVLGLGERHTKPARAFLRAANKQGGFDNVGDTANGLRTILSESFDDVDVETVGSAAMFTAKRPRRPRA
jgi:SAM-dependent methyltransferase